MGIFRKAERRKSRLKMALAGTAGSGKTHSALLLASGLIDDPGADTIALLDSENGSAELEAGKPGVPDFSVVNMAAPYSPERYQSVIKEAVDAGFKVLILDSISPEWNGEGGILDIVDRKKQSARNQMAAWKDATPMHQKFLDSIIQAPIHIIATMRSKTAYEVSSDGGKSKVQKLGTAPTQRDGIEFEFTLVGEITAAKHYCEFSKDRTGLFADAMPECVTKKTGQKIKDWLESGSDAEPAPTLTEVEEQPATMVPAEVFVKTAKKNGKEVSAECLRDADGVEYLLPADLREEVEGLLGSECTFEVMQRKGLPRLTSIAAC